MDIFVSKFKKNKQYIKLKCVYENETLGKLKTFVEINFDTFDVNIIKTYKKDVEITEEEVERLTEITKKDEDFIQKVIEFTKDYVEHLDGTKTLEPVSVFVISSQTRYIRIVRRFGHNLSQIEEKNEEQHSINFVAHFKEFNEEIYFNLKYNESDGYVLSPDKTEKMRLLPYWSEGNKEKIQSIFIEMVKEKAPFFLP